MKLRCLIQLPYDIKQLVIAKPIGLPQRLKPAINLIDRLEGIACGQACNHPLQLFGIPQGMLWTRGKKIQDHG